MRKLVINKKEKSSEKVKNILEKSEIGFNYNGVTRIFYKNILYFFRRFFLFIYYKFSHIITRIISL